MRRLIRLPFVVALSAFVSASVAATLALADSTRVISVEEHWELHVAQPDHDRSAPQTTMAMSPTSGLDGVHFLFTLNHSTVPEYAAGGLQVQLWNGDDLVQSQSAQEGVSLDQSDEVIHWTQKLSLQDGRLTFQIIDGDSQTWGTFGGDGLSVSTDTSLTALNSYHPGVSLTESQVNYAENRVTSLTLTKLVWVTDDGVVHEQDAPIPIDTSLDN